MRTAGKLLKEKVWLKCGKCCAYCGEGINLDQMQIDHIKPKYLGGGHDLENYNPACRRCNKWKATYSVEQFRDEITMQTERLFINSAGYRLALDYGLIKLEPVKVKFHFEKLLTNQRIILKE